MSFYEFCHLSKVLVSFIIISPHFLRISGFQLGKPASFD